MAGMSAGYPPEFDPAAEKIVRCEPARSKVLIETLRTHPKVATSTRTHRYAMVRDDGRWRLDRKETYSVSEGKWIQRVL
jgi:NTF2 fold immunity protein